MNRILFTGLAALVAAAGCVGDVSPDASLTDATHPAHPRAPAATRPTWDDPLAAPTSKPATMPADEMPSGHHHHHGGGH